MRTLYHRTKSLSRPLILLVTVNAALYALFMIADVCGISYPPLPGGSATATAGLQSIHLKYASVCVCLAISVIALRQTPYKKDARRQIEIFAFTLAADYLILFTPHYAMGVAVFCGAHLTAVERYGGAGTARLMAAVAGAAAAAVGFAASGLLPAAAAAYAVLITAATVCAFRRKQARMNNVMSRAGMVLFMLCDVNVLLWNMRQAANIAAIPEWTGTLMWAFYLPGQTMLALSAYDFERK
jgi:hypothetical protein